MTTRALPIIPSERLDDLHHLEIAEKADLVLFMAGYSFDWVFSNRVLFTRLHPHRLRHYRAFVFSRL